MNPMSSGKTTSEMWVTLAGTIVSLLVIYGILSTEQAEGWNAVVLAIIPIIFAIAPAVYTYSRTSLKKTAIENGLVEAPKPKIE